MLDFVHSEILFVVGGPEHRTTELLNIHNWQWNIKEPYPNVTDIQALNLISYSESFYVFGGVFMNTLVTNEILSFKNGTWAKVGEMLSNRIHFSVSLIVDKVYIVGGDKKQKSEVCKLSLDVYLYMDIVECEENLTVAYQNFKQPVLFSIDSCNEHLSKYETKGIKDLMILSNETFKEFDNFVKVQKSNYRIG